MSAPDIGDLERSLVDDALRTPTLSGGAMVERFERGVASLASRRYGVAVSSGTAGLHLATRALGITRGDTVLTTSFSFVASVNCFLYEGAVPLFADIDRRTYNLDPAAAAVAARRSAKRVAAILPVHVFGQPCDMTGLVALAQELECPIIEDACEAIGAAHADRPAGSFGDLAVFAFYPNKQMTTGEGGVVVTDDPHTAELCRSLRNQGRGSGDDWLTHVRLGYNYRLDEMSSALGVAQLERLDDLLQLRALVARRYDASLSRLPAVRTPYVDGRTTRMSWFVYVITLDAELERDGLARELADEGIPTRPYFRPIHLQPYFVERFGDMRGSLPVTEEIGGRTLALPFHSRLSEESIAYVTDALRRAIERQD